MILRESGISGDHPVTVDSDSSRYAILVQILLHLLLASFIQLAVLLYGNQIGLGLLLQRNLPCNLLGIGPLQNLLEQFAAGAIGGLRLLFQNGEHRTGKGEAIQRVFIVGELLPQMLMDGFLILAAGVIDAQNLLVPFCDGVIGASVRGW